MAKHPLTTVAGIMLLIVVAVVLVSSALAAGRAVDYHYAVQTAAMPAYRLAMESRTTAPAEERGSTAFIAGVALVAAAVVFIGGFVMVLDRGTKAGRELRLSRRKQPQRRPSPPAALPRTQPAARLDYAPLLDAIDHDPG